MSFKRKILTFTSSAYLLLFAFIDFVYGAEGKTETDWPASPLSGIELDRGTEFHEFLSYAYEWGIGMGGIFTFVILVLAGIEYITSEGNPEKMKKAMNRISSALLGLLLLLTSWLILHTINPHITSLAEIPSLWDEDMYEEEDFIYDDSEDHPCAFVVFYEETSFKGEPSTPFFPIPSGVPHAGYIKDNQSGKAFRKMTTEEKVILEERGIDGFRGRTIFPFKGENYIDLGPCVVTLYEDTNFWKTNCKGKISGTITLPNKNFAHTIFADMNDISCFVVENTKE